MWGGSSLISRSQSWVRILAGSVPASSLLTSSVFTLFLLATGLSMVFGSYQQSTAAGLAGGRALCYVVAYAHIGYNAKATLILYMGIASLLLVGTFRLVPSTCRLSLRRAGD